MSNSYTDKIKAALEAKISCLQNSITNIGINNKSISTSTDYELVLLEGELLSHIVVESDNSITFNIGTTVLGTEIYTDTIADGYEVISVDQFANGGSLSLYFSGYSPSSVKIHFFIQKAKLYI
jgi:hypothetical protein